MKKFILFFLLGYISCIAKIYAQYCDVTTAIPYNSDMPGITNVTFNTINRTSSDLEVPLTESSQVSTGLSTTVQQGNTYSISIEHTIDPNICPDMNIRVWIDYNHDFQLDDPGETVVSTDHHLPGIYSTSFTIPMTASLGDTRMRVTAKMSSAGGHSLPSPCDSPMDPFGYHGEIEDYTVNITAAAGVLEQGSNFSFQILSCASTVSCLSYQLTKESPVTIEVYDILGTKIMEVVSNEMQVAGKHKYNLGDGKLSGKSGIYFVKLIVNNKSLVRKMILG